MIDLIREKNKDLKIYSIYDKQFEEFGKIHDSKLFLDAFKYIEECTEIPENGNIYIGNDEKFRDYLNDPTIFDNIFGNVKIQYGFVNGQNTKLNALEYHKSSEINICVTPLVLLISKASKIKNGKIMENDILAFYVPENSVIEVFPYTLHFSPCKVVETGFKCGVILPYRTNLDFVKVQNINTFEDKLLFKTNKWLLAHPENTKVIESGAYVGIEGKNIEIKY